MGTLVIFKQNEMTVLEEVSEKAYLEMKKKAAEQHEEYPAYLIWHEDLHSEYGY
ncbi:hypothetical protein [Bacillus atrophaeus]|uniref:hypothetical protein n=1 Tax=Bacillus atrophaeus TaxID=1452 RepID=UPI003F597E2C